MSSQERAAKYTVFREKDISETSNLFEKSFVLAGKGDLFSQSLRHVLKSEQVSRNGSKTKLANLMSDLQEFSPPNSPKRVIRTEAGPRSKTQFTETASENENIPKN